MKTRDRILECSLELFNEEGEPNVTTLHVSTELDISPGNLYYHFKGKDSIIAVLFSDFEAQLSELQITQLPEDSPLLNMWAYLQLSFETMARYLFLFRDVADLLTRYPALQRRFNIILGKQRKSLLLLCSALNQESELLAGDEDVAALVEHMTMTMTFWLNYQRIRAARMDKFQPDLADCAYQVVSLLIPYLAADSKEDVKLLAQGYL
ncbi:MAG: TetR/AcrR family transcriptional regulator [Pseudomonadota bacterium]